MRNPLKSQVLRNILGIRHRVARAAFFGSWFLVVVAVFRNDPGRDPLETALTLVFGGIWAGFLVSLGVGVVVEVTLLALRALGRPHQLVDQILVDQNTPPEQSLGTVRAHAQSSDGGVGGLTATEHGKLSKASSEEAFVSRLNVLARLLSEGLITEQEFATRRAEILSEI